MKTAAAEKLARVLKWIVTVFFIFMLILLVFVPLLTGFREELSTTYDIKAALTAESVFGAWGVLFSTGTLRRTVLAWFMLVCGACGAVILWQARIVLANLSVGRMFARKNKSAMIRAGICCFVIAAASAVRLTVNLITYRSWAPLVTYTALFVPAFVFAGLIFLVAAALFAGAAELKEDNDLVI